MSKIICQNCFTILAERNVDEDWFKYDPNQIECIGQALSADTSLLTIACPKCGCMLQVKV